MIFKGQMRSCFQLPLAGPVLRAVWYAAELGGQVLGRLAKSDQEQRQIEGVGDEDISYRFCRSDLIQSIKNDYERNYFISGQGDMQCYAPNCLFSDPFVSFRGTQRFKVGWLVYLTS